MSEVPLEELRSATLAAERQLNAIVLGHARVIRSSLICILARGHVLIEGDVGVGKTTLLRGLARVLGGGYSRVEGSIDMTPGDLVYHTYLSEDGQPRVEPGPLLSHGEELSVFFFNEINRARPQVQALLLRAMTENAVNAFHRDHRVPYLLAFADRNRVERGETFELAAATRDRFMMELRMEVPTDPAERTALMFDPGYHDVDTLLATLDHGVLDYRRLPQAARQIQARIHASDAVRDYALRLMDATRDPRAAGIVIGGLDMGDLIEAGASPRGMALMLRAARTRAFLEGRDHIAPDDIGAVFHESIAHRIFFNPVHEYQRAALASRFTRAILDTVAAP